MAAQRLARATEAKHRAAQATELSIKSAFVGWQPVGSYSPSKWSGLTGNEVRLRDK